MVNSAEKVYKELLEKYKGNLNSKLSSYTDVLNEILLFRAEGMSGMYVTMVSIDGDSYGETRKEELNKKKETLEEELTAAIRAYQDIYGGKEEIIRSIEVSCLSFDRSLRNIVSMIGTEDYMIVD